MSNSDSLAGILERMTIADGAYGAPIPEGWMQGRTSYGGLSAGLALAVAQRDFPDLPPLRSAQIAFVGPLAGTVEIRTQLLRRGRTAAYVQSDLFADGRLGLRALLVFMHAQASHVDMPAALWGDGLPRRGAPFAPPRGVRFASQFELRDAEGAETKGAHILRWARLRERDGLAADVELVTVADMLPPAAMMLFERFGPISSMTWHMNLLAERLETEDGWWLLQARADQAQHGSSSQMMNIWNTRGEMVVSGMQSVALFV